MPTITTLSSLLASVGAVTLTPTIDVLWCPDGTGDVRTWDEVMTVVRGVRKPVTIWVKLGAGNYSIPSSSTPYEMKHSTLRQSMLGAYVIVEMAAGAVLRNLGSVQSCGLRVRPAGSAALEFDPPIAGAPAVFMLGLNGIIENAGSSAAIEIPDDGAFVLNSLGSAGVSAASTAALINFNGTPSLALIAIGGETSPTFPADSITGGGAANLIILHDGTAPEFPNFTSFAGTVLNVPSGVVGGAGPQAYRPVGGFNPSPHVGCDYFNTDSGGPEWWDGATWIAGSGGGAVNSVGGTAPIASTGGANPVISIAAATTADAGSLSAADKTKLDHLLLSGNTASRPLTPVLGEMYFDTDLGLAIWWNGAAWVSAAGLPA